MARVFSIKRFADGEVIALPFSILLGSGCCANPPRSRENSFRRRLCHAALHHGPEREAFLQRVRGSSTENAASETDLVLHFHPLRPYPGPEILCASGLGGPRNIHVDSSRETQEI